MEADRIGKRHAKDLEPDYRFWMEKETWQLLEAAKLLCGRDPLGRYPGRPRFNAGLKVIGVIDQAYEAVKEGALECVRDALIPNHVVLEPVVFLRWAASVGLAIPPGMASLMKETKPETVPGILTDVARERAIAVARTLWMVDGQLSLSEVLSHRAMKYIVADERFTTTQLADWISEFQPQ